MYHENKKFLYPKNPTSGIGTMKFGTSILMERNKAELLELLGKDLKVIKVGVVRTC